MLHSTSVRPSVFICYSHSDRAWLDRLLPVFEETAHTIDLWHDGLLKPGVTWYPELKSKLRDAQIAIALVSPSLVRSNFVNDEEMPYILAKFRAGGMLFVPFLLWGWEEICQMVDARGHSFWAIELQHAHEYGRSLEDYGDEAGDVVRAKLAAALAELANKPYLLRQLAEQSPGRVDIERLPRYGRECFGRADEIRFLDHAWRDRFLNVVAFVAGGGYGKSTLINKWLLDLGQHDWGGADRVFGWSFYNQGSEADRVYSASLFIDEGLRWFGDTAPQSGSPADRGERLARLIGSTNSILVLDGLEPLQWSVGEVRKVKDPALAALIEGLAADNKGLCVITSRQSVAELAEHASATTAERRLDALRPEDGCDMLRATMVLGTDDELLGMSKAVGNHALAVTLLGEWLTRERVHDRTHAALMTQLPPSDGGGPGADARRVLVAFEQVLRDSVQLALLRIVGLFDQPCTIAEVQALLASGEIAGVTLPFEGSSTDGLQEALGPLRDYKLVTYARDTKTIDAHPIVREHFASTFRTGLGASWQKAHAALARIFDRNAVAKPLTVDEATPMYRSAIHRALSGDLGETYDYYRSKILQGEAYYSQTVLAAYGNDLAVLAHLFAERWKSVSPQIDAAEHPKILRDAAVDWQTLGQFAFASEAMEASYATALAEGDLSEASFSASYLSELLVVRGMLPKAVHYGRESVALGRRSGDKVAYVSSLSSAGDALHQTGDLSGSQRLFREGIRYQKALQGDKDWRRHFTLQGFHYSCLQLSLGKARKVERWCRDQIRSGVSQSLSLLTFALDHIALGQALLVQYESGGGRLAQARQHIEEGLQLVRQGQDASFVPAGLLARAQLLRNEGNLAGAAQTLDGVTKVAQRGTGMPLYLIDADIERVKIAVLLARDGEPQIMPTIERIEGEIRRIGYRRRLTDIGVLKRSVQRRFGRVERRAWWPFDRS